MVSWRIDQDKWTPILKMWGSMSAEERAETVPGVSRIGRWHDSAARRGVAIYEASDLSALSIYLARWNPYMDLDVAAVLDDEESAEVAQAVMADADD